MKNFFIRITLFLFSFLLISFFLYSLFYPLYTANSVIFTFAITPFDIAKVYPKIWTFIKKTYFLFMFISYLIIFNYLYNTFQKYIIYRKNINLAKPIQDTSSNSNELKLLIGQNCHREDVFLKEAGLYQNMLITGTIGTRKNIFCYVSLYSSINILSSK